MTTSIRERLAILVAMLMASWLAYALTPTERMAQDGYTIDLAGLVPETFGDWKNDPDGKQFVTDPRVAETLNVIYTATLTRVYVDSNGRRVMLSIAYGVDQGRATQVHKPEVCYPAQGFSIRDMKKTNLRLPGRVLPAMQMVAIQNRRIEPLTYWIVVGDQVARGSIEQNIARLQYGIRGLIPDGLLFRVSSNEGDPENAYRAQAQFINDLFNAVPVHVRPKLFGQHAVSS